MLEANSGNDSLQESRYKAVNKTHKNKYEKPSILVLIYSSFIEHIPLGKFEFIVIFLKFVLLLGQHSWLLWKILKEKIKNPRIDRGKLTPCTLKTLTNNFKKLICKPWAQHKKCKTLQ